MSERFTIELPNEQAQYLRRIAELAEQSIEDLLVDALLNPIPPLENPEKQLAQVPHYSDAQLWAIVEIPVSTDTELAEREPLLQKAKQGIASPEDEQKLKAFSERYNQRELLRTEALVELQERGFNVKAYLKKNAPKP